MAKQWIMFDRPVVDATRPLRLRLRPEDIKGANPRDECSCVIARAICRMVLAQGHDGCASVGNQVVLIIYRRRVVRYILDRNERRMVEHYDIQPVASFPTDLQVTLQPPTGTQVLGYPRAASRKKRGPHTTKKPHDPRTAYQAYGRHLKTPRLTSIDRELCRRLNLPIPEQQVAQ